MKDIGYPKKLPDNLIISSNLDVLKLIRSSSAIVAFNSSILPAENLLLAKYSPEKYQSLVYGIKFIVSFSIGPIALLMISHSFEISGDFEYLYMIFGFVMIALFIIVLSLPSQQVKSGTAG